MRLRSLAKLWGRGRAREWVRNNGSWSQRELAHRLSVLAHLPTYVERRRLARDYLRRYAGAAPVEISEAAGYAVWDARGFAAVEEALEEARRTFRRSKGRPSPAKAGIEFVASGDDFAFGSAVTRLALHPAVLAPVTRYLGVLPVLFSLSLMRSPNERLHELSSQFFHRDPEDTREAKVFVHVEDVGGESGPLGLLRADASARVAAALRYRTGRLTDEQVFAVVPESACVVFTGPAGTVVFADTARCFHFGSRPGGGPRHVLLLQYVTPFATWFPLFPGDGEGRTHVASLFDDRATPFERRVLGMAR